MDRPDLPAGAPQPAPSPREQLMQEWRAARARRHAAELGSDAYRLACDDIARIEIEIARVERAMDPPRV
jgi:hypothetical protein